jgi:hypothetical protein
VSNTAGPGGRLPLPAPLRLPAMGITDDGLIDLGPDGTTALLAASTVAFGLRTPGEQNGLVAGFARWLHSLDGPAQILVRAQRVDLTEAADRILAQAPGLPDPALEAAARAHAAFLDTLAAERDLLHRQVTVAVRSRPQRPPRPRDRARPGRLRSHRPDPRRHRHGHHSRRVSRPGRPSDHGRYGPVMKLLTLRRNADPQVTAAPGVLPGSPDAVEVAARWVRVGDDYCTTLAVTGYPAEVDAGWLEPILSYPGRVDVVLHIEPVPPVVAAQRLKKQRGRFESSRRADANRGRLDDPEVEAAAADAAELAARLARGEARLFRVALYLTVHGSSPEDLAERVVEVRALAASLLLGTAPVTWRQLQGFITGLPLAYDALGMRRVFDTDALAAAFPFTSPDLPVTAGDTGMGVLYGLNLHSPGVVLWDRWAQSNYNAVILARSGEGKSYLAKLDLLRNLYLGVEAFVIDPEDEYLALAEAVGGTVIRPGAPGVRINPLDLSPGDGADALIRRALFMQTFVAVLTGGDHPTGGAVLAPEEAAALDVAVLAAYRAKGITTDPRTWRRPPPLLADLADELAALNDAGRRVAARLRPYVAGSFKTLFDGPTTTGADGHLVVYAIKELPEELKAVGTLLTLDAIWRTIRTPNRDTSGSRPEGLRMMLVDEAWRLLSGGLGGRFLETLAKSARKYGAGLTVVTQDAADVLATKVGRAVVSNAATQILLRQAPQAIDAVAEAFGLTDGERVFLLSAARGDALLACGSARVAFHSIADADVEHQLVVTGPQATRRR